MSPFVALLDAKLQIAGSEILWREIIGNLFGLASAIGGMRRRVWAWPVGIAGNVLLFTVFLGGVFHTPQALDLAGQAGRQVLFVVVSVYGWWQWRATRDGTPGDDAVRPHWATNRERVLLAAAMIAGTVVFAQIFGAIGSYGKWSEAWIFTGSMLATWGMARGWTEFWLIWIGVDAVGVPLLLHAGYYPSAALYLVYAAFVLWGFVVWLKATRAEPPAQRLPAPTR